MKVEELRSHLEKLDSEVEVVVVMNGRLAPILEVLAVAGSDFIVIRGQGTGPPPRHFTNSEEGIIGHLVRMGVSNEKIGEVLGRPAKSVAQKRKSLGF